MSAEPVLNEATEKVGGIVQFKYLNLKPFGGIYARGGAVKVFMQVAGIQFEEELVEFADWLGGLKQKAIESGENTSGYLPIMKIAGKTYCECVATARFMSRKLGMYGVDVDRDYMIDSVSDQCTSWREHYLVQFLSEDPAVKEKYKAGRANYYRALDCMITRYGGSGACLVGDTLSYADALMYTQIYDDIISFGEEELANFPQVSAFYKAFAELPAMKSASEAA